MKINPRIIATKVLLQVIQKGQSLTTALAGQDLQNTQANLVKELCFGVCRWYFRLELLANNLLSKPLKAKDQDIYVLILLGLYQILYLRVPTHAAVLETVEAAKALKKLWATKLINGVLRTFLRQKEALLTQVDHTLVGRYAHPLWLTEAILAVWPEQGEAILEANNQHPPLCLRVNRLQITLEDYLKSLADNGIAAERVVDPPGVRVARPQKGWAVGPLVGGPPALPGFEEGQFSIQDSAAQFAAPLLLLEKGQRVLDACAAPGGKTTHILETEPQLSTLVAIDKEESRLQKVKENVQRLKLPSIITYHAVDATKTDQWWDGQLFDRILLDAPCSGTGVVRRHSDIKLLRRAEDIGQLVQQQQALLEALWPLLKTNGLLLYVTCSIFPRENEEAVQQFLQTHPDAREQKIIASWGMERSVGRQILTGEEDRDGFYYARLVKTGVVKT